MKNFNFDFQSFIQSVAAGKTVNTMPRETVEKVFEIGTYCGIFSGETNGYYDTSNTVSLLVTTLQHMMGSESEISVKASPKNLEERVAELERKLSEQNSEQ